jgi:hypothetical protein
MAYARIADDLHDLAATTSRPKHRRGFFRRAFDAMVEARQRSVEREIALFLKDRGQYLTDDAEREIERILSSSARF